MLTADLLIARQYKGKVIPSYIKDKDKGKHLDIISNMISIFKSSVGKSWGDLEESLNSVSNTYINVKVIKGYIKLLKDRCTTGINFPLTPDSVRRTVFHISSSSREVLSTKDEFDRHSVLVKASEELGITPKDIERMIYADLKSEQVINDFEPISPEALYNKYNLSLAQAVLFKAVKVTVRVKDATPAQYRMLFRYIKFFRLIHQVTGNDDTGYEITLDGPFSLFKSVQKYGLNMAMFLPALILLEKWELEADLLWGSKKEKSKFYLDSSQGLVSHYKISAQNQLDEVDTFFTAFQGKKTNWDVSTKTDIINFKGEGVSIPDFIFTNKKSGTKVYMEVFGYWSRDTVWKRIESIEKMFPHPFILVVNKSLRISEKAAKEELPARVFVYNTSISVNSIIKLLNEVDKSQVK